MQIQNSAHLNCCCVHGIHSLIAIPLARHKDCLSASVNTKKLWQRTRGGAICFWICSEREDHYSVRAHRRRRRSLSLSLAHRALQITSALTSIFSFVRRKCICWWTLCIRSESPPHYTPVLYVCAISSGEQIREEHRNHSMTRSFCRRSNSRTESGIRSNIIITF